MRPAGWVARIGSSGPARPAWLKAAAARFRCRPERGHIMAAARLQLVTLVVIMILKDTVTSSILFILSHSVFGTSLLWRSTVAFTYLTS